MVTGKCTACGGAWSYEPNILMGREWCKPTKCPECSDRECANIAAMEQERQHELRRSEWKTICPTIYRETDVSRLDAKKTAEVTGWQFGPRGLLLHGRTGTGKTRMAFLLCERLHMEGRSVSVFHGNQFAHQCAEAFGEFEGESWISGLARADVVFIDDLGKFKMTERVEAELFGLVEMRVAWKRPLIVTVNFGGDALADKMTGDRGGPLVRRLREFCHTVSF